MASQVITRRHAGNACGYGVDVLVRRLCAEARLQVLPLVYIHASVSSLSVIQIDANAYVSLRTSGSPLSYGVVRARGRSFVYWIRVQWVSVILSGDYFSAA